MLGGRFAVAHLFPPQRRLTGVATTLVHVKLLIKKVELKVSGRSRKSVRSRRELTTSLLAAGKLCAFYSYGPNDPQSRFTSNRNSMFRRLIHTAFALSGFAFGIATHE